MPYENWKYNTLYSMKKFQRKFETVSMTKTKFQKQFYIYTRIIDVLRRVRMVYNF